MKIVLSLLLAAYAQYYGERQSAPPKGKIPDVEVAPHLGAQLPLELSFADENGASIALRDYFGGDIQSAKKPVILALVYYECPMLCTMVLNGLVRGLKPLSLSPGKDFEVVVLSIDPGETPALALQKKKTMTAMFARPASDAGWHFLTGGQTEIEKVARAVGLGYVYQPELDQYAHAAAITVLTSEGKVSRYLYGVDYAPKDLKLAVVESSEGKIASFTDKLLLLCYHYDPINGKYGFAIMSALRAAGVLTVFGIVGAIFGMVRRERKNRARAGA